MIARLRARRQAKAALEAREADAAVAVFRHMPPARPMVVEPPTVTYSPFDASPFAQPWLTFSYAINTTVPPTPLLGWSHAYVGTPIFDSLTCPKTRLGRPCEKLRVKRGYAHRVHAHTVEGDLLAGRVVEWRGVPA